MKNATDYAIKKRAPVKVTFDAVTTTALRFKTAALRENHHGSFPK